MNSQKARREQEWKFLLLFEVPLNPHSPGCERDANGQLSSHRSDTGVSNSMWNNLCFSSFNLFFFSHTIIKFFQHNFLNWQDTRDNLNFWVTSSRKASLLLILAFLSPAGASCSNDNFFYLLRTYFTLRLFYSASEGKLATAILIVSLLANTASNAASCSRPYIIHRDKV